MKATYTAMGGQIHFEMEAGSPKDMWKKLALVQDIFDVDDKCGACGGHDLKFQHRNVDDFEYFEMQCKNDQCRARLSFGQNKIGGGLFAKRKDKDGDSYLPNRGWQVYKPKHTASSTEPPQTQPSQRPNEISDDDVPFRWPRPLAAGSKANHENLFQMRSVEAGRGVLPAPGDGGRSPWQMQGMHQADVSGNYRSNKGHFQRYDIERNKRPERVRSRSQHLRNHRARNPEKNRARRAVALALRTGRLVRKPCERCNNAKSEAHHPDYSKPLDVQWLCLKHHREVEGRA